MLFLWKHWWVFPCININMSLVSYFYVSLSPLSPRPSLHQSQRRLVAAMFFAETPTWLSQYLSNQTLRYNYSKAMKHLWISVLNSQSLFPFCSITRTVTMLNPEVSLWPRFLVSIRITSHPNPTQSHLWSALWRHRHRDLLAHPSPVRWLMRTLSIQTAVRS